MSINSQCPICKACNPKYLGEKNSIQILECKACTHVFANIKDIDLDQEDLDVFRDGITNGLMSSDAEYYDHLVQGEAPGFPTHITATKVLDIVQKAGIEKGRWLDIGSGSGHLVKRAQDQGFEVLGLEPGGWGQIAAKNKNISINQGFLGENLAGLKFSVVSATDVVEHVAEPAEFLRLMSTYVAKNGFIVISVPCYDSLDARLFGMNWSMIAPPTHRHFFTKKSLKTVMESAGLHSLTMEQFNIRRLLRLSQYSAIRKITDLLIPGDQIACLIANK